MKGCIGQSISFVFILGVYVCADSMYCLCVILHCPVVAASLILHDLTVTIFLLSSFSMTS